MTFCDFNHADCFRRRLSESRHLTFRVTEKPQYTSNISGQEDLFSFASCDPKWDKLSRTHTPPLVLLPIVSLTWSKWFKIHFLKVKLSVLFPKVK